MATMKSGTTLANGRWRIDEQIVAGRSYDVYLGADLHLDGKKVILKTARAADSDATATTKRLEAEARFLTTPSALIPEPLDFIQGDQTVLVVERLSGESLREVLARTPGEIGAARAVAIIRELALFADELHAAGYLFRDFAPEHVVIGFDDVVNVIGTGNAGRLGDAARAEMPCSTAGFAAPEIAAGEPCDARTDVFGLGALLSALTKHPEAQAISRQACGPKSARYPSAAEMARALARIVVAPPSPMVAHGVAPRSVAAAQDMAGTRSVAKGAQSRLEGSDVAPAAAHSRAGSKWIGVAVIAVAAVAAIGLLLYLLATQQ